MNIVKEKIVKINKKNFFHNFKSQKIKKNNVAIKNIILEDLSFVKITVNIEIIIIGMINFFIKLFFKKNKNDKKNNLLIKDPATLSSPNGPDNLLP
tara:strand:- start:383 stop:670 length:288 start_codon:yes stop_codon:yes gene_type:complete